MSTHASRSLVVISFLLLSARLCDAAAVFTPFVAEVIEDDVNVRAGQSTNFERICQLKKGEEVVVLGKEFSWFKIQLPAKAKVYISDKYVIKRRSDQGQVTAPKVNVRAGADINFSVVGQADEGQLIALKEHKDGWYAIEPLRGHVGWVSEEFLKFKTDTLPSGMLEPMAEDLPVQEALAPAAAPAQDAPAAVGAQAAPGDVVTVTGVLSAPKDAKAQGVHYKIDDNGRTYLIDGLDFSLDNFLGFNVRATGHVADPSFGNSGLPLLKLTKIQLIL